MKRLTTTTITLLALVGAGLIVWALAPALPASPLANSFAQEVSPTATLPPVETATPLPTATSTITPASTASPTATVAPSRTPTSTPVASRAIFVDQDAQMMHVYENGVEIKAIPCSTGKPLPYHWTPGWSGTVGHYVGTFYTDGVYVDDAWFLFVAGGDILIHSVPYTVVNGQKVYQDQDLLGASPSSHGCIRVSPEDAHWLTEWNPEGVPACISTLTGEDAP